MQKKFCSWRYLTQESVKIWSHSVLDHPLHNWSRNTCWGEDLWFELHPAQNDLYDLYVLQLVTGGTVSAKGHGERAQHCQKTDWSPSPSLDFTAQPLSSLINPCLSWTTVTAQLSWMWWRYKTEQHPAHSLTCTALPEQVTMFISKIIQHNSVCSSEREILQSNFFWSFNRSLWSKWIVTLILRQALHTHDCACVWRRRWQKCKASDLWLFHSQDLCPYSLGGWHVTPAAMVSQKLPRRANIKIAVWQCIKYLKVTLRGWQY